MALGSVLNKVKHCHNLGFKTDTQLYNSSVCPVSDNASGVWGLKENQGSKSIHYRTIKAFLEVHQFTSVLAISGDMGQKPPNIRHKYEMLRLWNR